MPSDETTPLVGRLDRLCEMLVVARGLAMGAAGGSVFGLAWAAWFAAPATLFVQIGMILLAALGATAVVSLVYGRLRRLAWSVALEGVDVNASRFLVHGRIRVRTSWVPQVETSLRCQDIDMISRVYDLETDTVVLEYRASLDQVIRLANRGLVDSHHSSAETGT